MIVWLAPMDWVTDCAYRTVCKQLFEKYWNPWDELMLRTEFMSAEWYKHNPPGVVKHLLKTDYEPELIAQIFWWDPKSLIHCAQDIEKHYDFWGIELNMWCPSPKIMKCAAWSGMLRDKKKTLEIIKEISASIKTPFSLKTRVWLSKDDVNEQFDFMVEASQYVSMIWIHWRLYKQWHSWDVDWDFIYRLKKRCPHIKVLGNWWLRTYEQLIEKSQPLDGSMIAQSAIWNPRVLFPHNPSIKERFDTIFTHLGLAMAQEQHFKERALSEKAQTWILVQPTYEQLQQRAATIEKNPEAHTAFYTPREFRKYLFNYISWLDWNKAIKKNIPQAREYHELKYLLESYRDQLLVQS